MKEQYVTVVCDDQTAHPNIQYQLKNLPAGSVDVQWDGAAKTAKLVLKPEKLLNIMASPTTRILRSIRPTSKFR